MCGNGPDVPMADADAVLSEALLDDVITPDIVTEAVDAALALVADDGRLTQALSALLEQELSKAERERVRLALQETGFTPRSRN